jgi:serine/threonine protein kinase
MAEEEIPEDFFNNLQSLNSHFSNAFSGEESQSLLEQELAAVEERYEDSGEVDKGGMKSILSSTDKMTLRQVAKAKIRDLKPENSERFIKEARLTASLEHPNIIPIYDLGLDGNEPFFTMKMVEGENLSDLILTLRKNSSEYSRQDLMQIFLKICDAIAYAHYKKVIHLDLKPANIRLGQFGEVIVCDWGLAKIIGDDGLEGDTVSLDPNIYNDATLDGIVKGSPGYLAPEQVSKKYGSKDEKTDIYALGGILYSLLTFRPPIDTKNLEQCLKDTVAGNIIDPLTLNSKVPQSLAAVAMKSLSVDKNERYSSVIELRTEINRWLSGFATDAEDARVLTSLWLLVKRHKMVCSLILVIIFVTVALNVQIFIKERRALEARALYLEEKENSRKEDLKNVPHLFRLSQQEIRNYDFDKALEYINLAVGKDIENEELWSEKGKIHFLRQEFNAAEDAFGHVTLLKRFRKLQPLSVEFGARKKDGDLLSLGELAEFLVKMQHVQYAFLMCGYAEIKALTLEYRVGVAMVFMKNIANRSIDDWDCDIDIKDGTVSMDFSRISGITSLSGIRNLPILKLNISNTSVSQTQDLLKLPLVEINISDCKILDPRPILRIESLKKMIISKTQFPDMNFSDKVTREGDKIN